MKIIDSAALDTVAAARRIGIAPSTLTKLRLSGAGPVYCKLGRRVVYLTADLDAFLEAHRKRSTSDEMSR
jgi:hypothetical protein